jgi:hypothetical protein
MGCCILWYCAEAFSSQSVAWLAYFCSLDQVAYNKTMCILKTSPHTANLNVLLKSTLQCPDVHGPSTERNGSVGSLHGLHKCICTLPQIFLICRQQGTRLSRSLSKIEYHAGCLLKVVNPDLFLKVTKRFDISNNGSEPVHWCRANLFYDSNRNTWVPQCLGVHHLARDTRLMLRADRYFENCGICLGQRVPLIKLKNRAGFKVARLEPEVRIGINAASLHPTLDVHLKDDDYSGYSFQPLYHPAVICTGAALYAAMMRWRFPLSLSVPLGKCGIGHSRSVEIQMLNRLQRTDANRICTLGVRGAMLTLRV